MTWLIILVVFFGQRETTVAGNPNLSKVATRRNKRLIYNFHDQQQVVMGSAPIIK